MYATTVCQGTQQLILDQSNETLQRLHAGIEE